MLRTYCSPAIRHHRRPIYRLARVRFWKSNVVDGVYDEKCSKLRRGSLERISRDRQQSYQNENRSPKYKLTLSRVSFFVQLIRSYMIYSRVKVRDRGPNRRRFLQVQSSEIQTLNVSSSNSNTGGIPNILSTYLRVSTYTNYD